MEDLEGEAGVKSGCQSFGRGRRRASAIADRLALSHRTVQNHVPNARRKLQIHNRVELTRHAIQRPLGSSRALAGASRHHGRVKRALVLLVLLVQLGTGCSSGATSSTAPTSTPTSAPAQDSWLTMAPEDVRAFDGPGGELLLIFVDETYDIDGTYASALTWRLGEDYTTDYFVEDDSGSLWWYGRRGSWRAGRHGEQPRLVLDAATADQRVVVDLGDLAVTLERGSGPVRVETPQGVYEPDTSAGASS